MAAGIASGAADVQPSVAMHNSRGGDYVLRSLFGCSGFGVVQVDRRGSIVETNQDFFHLFGCEFRDVLGSRFSDLLHPSVRDMVGRQFERVIDGQRSSFTERIVATHGRKVTFSGQLTGVPVHDETGRIDSVMALLRPDSSGRQGHAMVRSQLQLTDMNAKILEGIAAGVSTVQLAAMLYLSRGGVEYHVTILLKKLKVKNRPELVSKAYSIGLLGVGSWPPKVLSDYVQ